MAKATNVQQLREKLGDGSRARPGSTPCACVEGMRESGGGRVRGQHE